MVPFFIEEGQSTPKISLDCNTGKFEITGNSLPEDVLGFYTPMFDWLEKYIENPLPRTDVHIKLSYFNSASSKIILDFIAAFEEVIQRGLSVEIFWHYLDLDDDMLSAGKEFESIVTVPFQFFPYYNE